MPEVKRVSNEQLLEKLTSVEEFNANVLKRFNRLEERIQKIETHLDVKNKGVMPFSKKNYNTDKSVFGDGEPIEVY